MDETIVSSIVKSGPTSKRLVLLRESLRKKEAEFDRRLSGHFDDVRSANGQPLNDKRNGAATTGRWERQNDGLRRLKEGIERTKRAIEREENAVADATSVELPDFLRAMVAAGELNQWCRHPNTFFVPGVERGRIVWDTACESLTHRYVSEIPKPQFPAFRDAFNKANAAFRAYLAAPPVPPAGAETGGERA